MTDGADASRSRLRQALTLDDATMLLARTPPVLQTMLTGLPAAWLAAHEGDDTWSPYDVVGHLLHGERTDWLPRARMILEHGETRTFEPFDRLAQFRESQGRSIDDLLEQFADARRGSLEALAALQLTPADLDRTGRHPTFGVVTLRQLLATWVAHDFDHLVQIPRVLARQYSDEVGPWRAYLRVINGSSI